MPAEPEHAHPLFPNDDEDRKDDGEPIPVSQIQITRLENGQQVFAPRVRQATELLSLDQIFAELGGGTYVLIARHEGRITTRRKYVIPGKPKPMFDEGVSDSPPQAATVTPISQPSGMMGGDGSIMGMLVTMMQMMMQSQAQASQQNTQLMIAMMSAGRESSAEDKAAARAEMAQNIERERINSERTMSLMREMMSAKGGGSGEDFTRGVEFMRSFATQQIETLRSSAKGEDTDWGSLLETLGQVMQGAGMLKSVMGGGLPEGAAQAVAETVQ